MCGLAGIYNLGNLEPIKSETLLRMRDLMIHRGPDDAGIFIDEQVGLAHRRLSILDLSEAGKQPFSYQGDNIQVVFNGEIFNYLELKALLETKGYTFRTRTDTEVLCAMYLEYGVSMLDHLNGMFAFALYDCRKHSLFIARDRIGVKPLYYSISNGKLYFASEIKAILGAGVDHAVMESCLTELLLFKYIAGENTIYKEVKRLLPGHYILITGQDIEVTKWWDLKKKILDNRENLPANPKAWFEETFYSSVRYRTISDVPVGVMLSGGLDSGCVAVALNKLGVSDMATFTVTFDNPQYNEGLLAESVAGKFGLRYNEINLSDFELFQRLDEAAWLYDEPLVHQNDAQMLALSHNAKPRVSVLLSGDGSDELLGGYFRYKPLKHIELLRSFGFLSALLSRISTNDIVNRFEKLNRYLKNKTDYDMVSYNTSNIFKGDFKKLGIELDTSGFDYRNTIQQEAMELYPKELPRQAMYMDLHIHMASILDRNDRMTMGASIECREPFLDYRFLEMLPALPSKELLKGKKGKWILFDTIGKELPHDVRSFKKLGFSVPWDDYLAKNAEFLDFFENLENNAIMQYPIFDRLPANRIKALYKLGNGFAVALIRQLYMFNLWQKQFHQKIQT